MSVNKYSTGSEVASNLIELNPVLLSNLTIGIITGITVGFFMIIIQFIMLPLIQKRIKKEQDLWVFKKDTYIESIALIDKKFDSITNEAYTKPERRDVNMIYRKILLITDNSEIIKEFPKFFDNDETLQCSPGKRVQFISLVRKDLGKKHLNLDYHNIPYFTV